MNHDRQWINSGSTVCAVRSYTQVGCYFMPAPDWSDIHPVCVHLANMTYITQTRSLQDGEDILANSYSEDVWTNVWNWQANILECRRIMFSFRTRMLYGWCGCWNIGVFRRCSYIRNVNLENWWFTGNVGPFIGLRPQPVWLL